MTVECPREEAFPKQFAIIFLQHIIMHYLPHNMFTKKQKTLLYIYIYIYIYKVITL